MKRFGRNAKENKEEGFEENADWLAVGSMRSIHPWIRWELITTYAESGYVGRRRSYIIERKGEARQRVGSHTADETES